MSGTTAPSRFAFLLTIGEVMKYLRFPLECIGIGVAALILAGLRIASILQGRCNCPHWHEAHNEHIGCTQCGCMATRKS